MRFIWTYNEKTAPQKVNHASATVDDQVFVLGGYCTDEAEGFAERKITVNVLNTFDLIWKDITDMCTGDTPEDIPFNRYGHTAVSKGHLIYLWGGRSDARACNTLFILDTTNLKWKRQPTSGIIPNERDGHAAAIIGDNMYIYGGYEEPTELFSMDIHVIDLDTFNWILLRPAGCMSPAWRDFHTMTAFQGKLYVFGGRCDQQGQYHSGNDYYDNKMYCYDPERNEWENLSNQQGNGLIEGRRSHSCVVYENKLIIFAGFNGLLNQHYNDVFVYLPRERTFHSVHIAGKEPESRRRHSCQVVKNHMIIFGGTSPIAQDDDALVASGDSSLKDRNDTCVLDLSPRLETICKLFLEDNSIPNPYSRNLNRG